MVMKPYLSPSDKDLCGGVGGWEGRGVGKGSGEEDDDRMYREHGGRLFALSCAPRASLCVLSLDFRALVLLNGSRLDEMTQLEDSAAKPQRGSFGFFFFF